jgi:hypothetical protein
MIRDYVVGSRQQQLRFLPGGYPAAPPPPVERPTVLLIGTVNDDRYAWVAAGREPGRLLLDATVAGIAASPLTQALDWPETRRRMRSRPSLVGHPQQLLRLGSPSTPDAGPPSGRRPVADVLRFESPG